MKAELGRLIGQKLAANLEILIVVLTKPTGTFAAM